MTLLNEVMNKPLDPGYAEAAQRRRAGGPPPRPVARRLALAVVAAGLGLALTAATSALRAPQPEAAEARILLTEQIAEQGDRSAALLAANDAVSREIAELRNRALSAQDPSLLQLLARDEQAAGTASVSGPGLRLTLTDAPAERGDVESADPDQRVQDVDLQVVTNGLWAAGAEAIAVNGQRLTVLTAIRSAGSAILVDLAPLTGPYVVEAIGDPAAMQTAFARTSAAQHLSTLRNTYGIGSEISAEAELVLPGSPRTRLRSAEPVTPPQPGSGPARSEEPATEPGSAARGSAATGRGTDAGRSARGDVASSGPSNERDPS